MSMMPAGSFNPQMTAADIQKASFVTRLYGLHNQRGPYFYPQSPYALPPTAGMGDIAPMEAMQPIDQYVLFTQLPTQGVIGTSTAPIGSAGFPTFQATAPQMQGTVLGPSGPAVAELPNSGVGPGLSAPGDLPSGSLTPLQGSGLVPPDWDNGAPAATPGQSIATGQPAGPITFMNPWPSIISPPPQAGQQQVSQAPSALCEFGAWVNQNPALALLGTVGVYFLFKGGKKR